MPFNIKKMIKESLPARRRTRRRSTGTATVCCRATIIISSTGFIFRCTRARTNIFIFTMTAATMAWRTTWWRRARARRRTGAGWSARARISATTRRTTTRRTATWYRTATRTAWRTTILYSIISYHCCIVDVWIDLPRTIEYVGH